MYPVHRLQTLNDNIPIGPKHNVPPLAVTRPQRWALILTGHDYGIVFQHTKDHEKTDGLSRSPLPNDVTDVEAEGLSVFNMSHFSSHRYNSGEQLVQDLMLPRRVPRCAKDKKWPRQISSDFKPYWSKRTELTVEGDCVMWGISVIIPAKLQVRVLEELHQSHTKIEKTKALVRR